MGSAPCVEPGTVFQTPKIRSSARGRENPCSPVFASSPAPVAGPRTTSAPGFTNHRARRSDGGAQQLAIKRQDQLTRQGRQVQAAVTGRVDPAHFFDLG